MFSSEGLIYRQVNKSYSENYDFLIISGLYDKLASLGYLIPHEEVKLPTTPSSAYKIIQPKQIPFISYPYEWCFGMLKAAAILTLSIQKIALEYGMSLKDGSSFNVQFLEGKPVLIDTLSFEIYQEGKPWVAYKQFVEHFLAPLALMSLTDIRLNRLTSVFLDGVPVDLASRLLPLLSRLRLPLLLHIFAHSRSQQRYSQTKLTNMQMKHSFSKNALLGLVDNLDGAIRGLKWNPEGTEWSDYYGENNNYDNESLREKGELVRGFLKIVKPKKVWDFGANTGRFSRIAAKEGASVISFDNDYGAMEANFSEVVKNKEKNVLPLFCDLTNPSPSLGWANQERLSLLERGPADVALALALVHHLAIGKNIPLDLIASFFSQAANFLIIEFVPKDDSQVQKLLMNREDIFPDYTKLMFEKVFGEFFQIKKTCLIKGSKRTLYLMVKKKK